MKKIALTIFALLFAATTWGQDLRYEVSHLHDSVNTTGSETGVVIIDDSIILYTTMQMEESPRLYLVDFNPILTEIYQAPIDTAGTIGRGTINQWGLNANGMNNGNVAYDPKADIIYITRSESGDRSFNHIYYSHRVNKRWSKLQKLKGDVNLNGYNSTHPTIGYLPTGQTILYFSSDRPGGLGGMDIWYAIIISEGTPGNCTNLGTPVNSDSNDVTPYYSNEEGILYFSSNRSGGLGEMDVYCSQGMRNSWQTPQNLGPQINTPYDDLYFNFQPCRCRCPQHDLPENEFVVACGFLSSNRPGSLYKTSQNCCNDLYRWRRIFTKPDTTTVYLDTAQPRSVQDLLPLSLYFHNDEPNAKTLDTTTTLDYTTTWHRYMQLREEYKGAQSNPVDPRKRDSIQKGVDYFFEFELKKGHLDMAKFFQYLQADLQAGKKVSITINGYASPLFESLYNVNISKRRIDCFRNSLKRWNNGVLLPYLENGSIRIETVANGAPSEDQVASNSPLRNPKSVRSVYDMQAAHNRRIDIVAYQLRIEN